MHQGGKTSLRGCSIETQRIEKIKISIQSGIAAIACSLIFACGRSSEPRNSGLSAPAVMSSIVRRGLPGEVETLDPQLANDNFSLPVVRDLYEGLTTEDLHGRPVPGAASSWSIDTRGTTYTFTIRPDARWSNGERVTSEDFVRGLRRAIDPHTASGAAALLSVLKGATQIIAGAKKPESLSVRSVGEDQLEVELEHPAPYVLQILSEPIAAPTYATSAAKDPSAKTQKPIVNGPYEVSSRVLGSYIELRKNESYWNTRNVAIDRIRYSIQESEGTELNQYLAGEIDLTSTIPASDLARLGKFHKSEIQSEPFLGTVYLALNLTKPPLELSSGIRQALSMTIDREAIAEHVIVGVTPAYGFVAKGVSDYSGPSYEWQNWSMDERTKIAQRLYSQAGFSDRHPLHLTLYFNSGDSIQRTMIAVAANWQDKLGVSVELKSAEFRVFLSERKDRSRWDVMRLGWFADYDDPSSFLDVFSNSGKENDPAYSRPSYDALLKNAENQPDIKKRTEGFSAAEDMLLRDYPIIPLYFYRQRRLVNLKLRGAEITPLNHSRSMFLYWDTVPASVHSGTDF